MMKYIIAKGSKELPLFWSRDGWKSNSYWAAWYESEEAAWKAINILGLNEEINIRVETRD